MSDSNEGCESNPPSTEGSQGPSPSSTLDGSAFLSHLRAAQLLSYGQSNDETIGASNTSDDMHRRDISSLSGLFETPMSPTPEPLQQQQQQRVGGGRRLPQRPTSIQHGSRTVSWSKTIAETTKPPPPTSHTNTASSLMQPALNETDANAAPRFQLDDLLTSGPYEQEAETNILKALEEQQGLRARADTGTSTILSGVPEAMAHNFSLASASSTNEENGSLLADRHDVNQDNASRGSESVSVASFRHRREQSRALLNQQKKQTQHHRRLMSVEETLAGLTSAMTALDHETVPIDAIQEDELINEPTAAASTGVKLAENAALLTRHDGNEDERARHRSAKERWNHVIDNLPTVRETEDRRESDETERDESDSGNDVEACAPASPEPKVPTQSKKPSKRRTSVFRFANDKLKDDLETFNNFFQPRKEHVWWYIKSASLYVILPLVSTAAILYYAADNPPTGRGVDSESRASTSWWLLFVVRQVITLSMALCMQMLIIDFLAIGTRVVLRLVGPVLTLLIVQSKGWPFVVFWWGVFDFAMLHGTYVFAAHWLFWQNPIGLFNTRNPSGHVIDSVWNMRVLTIAVCVSAAVAVRRFVVGLYLSRQTYAHFGKKLARLMHKMLLVSEVAGLAREIEKAVNSRILAFPEPSENFGWGPQRPEIAIYSSDDEDSNAGESLRRDGVEKVIDTSHRDPLTGALDSSEKLKIMQLLERWEEPDRYMHHLDETATISAVLRFRNALALIQQSYPFSYAFGPADTREASIDSAQRVYGRLLLRTPGENVLTFDTLVHLALQKDGTIDQQKANDLVKLFRPDRQGNLSMLDFLKSTDQVYKEYRLLLASIHNSTQIDQSLEKIMNLLFYAVVVTITLAALGIDTLALFISLSTVVLSFAFIIGTASSKYFEGVLFILVRRPYSIGDLMNVSNIESETSFDGSPGWLVEHVTLFETVATWAPTNERASLSNGSLASSRIINWNRSPQAQFHIYLNFPIDTPYDKILIFKRAVEEYMKERPREWLSLNGFRANRILPEQGFVEYAIVIQHRDCWQNIGQILDSKANLSSYCMEVTKQLDMNYRAPPLPVDLTYSKAAPALAEAAAGTGEHVVDDEAQLQAFRSIVNKHNIRVN